MAGEEAKMGLPATTADRAGANTADPGESIERHIAAGEHREALALCAKQHATALGRLCMAFTGSQAEAEELVQETLLAAFDGFAAYRAEGSVRSYLYGIARRLCGRHVEKRARREARLRLVHDTGRGAATDELAAARERAERARTALAELKPSEREAVVLRYQAELDFRELALATGVDEATARKRVSRALARLRAKLGEE